MVTLVVAHRTRLVDYLVLATLPLLRFFHLCWLPHPQFTTTQFLLVRFAVRILHVPRFCLFAPCLPRLRTHTPRYALYARARAHTHRFVLRSTPACILFCFLLLSLPHHVCVLAVFATRLCLPATILLLLFAVGSHTFFTRCAAFY